MNEYVKSDLYRIAGQASIGAFLKAFLLKLAFRYMVGIRLMNSHGIEKCIGFVLNKINRNRYIHITKDTKIGYGFLIVHNGPVVINPTAIVGSNCTISQCTTIGSRAVQCYEENWANAK